MEIPILATSIAESIVDACYLTESESGSESSTASSASEESDTQKATSFDASGSSAEATAAATGGSASASASSPEFCGRGRHGDRHRGPSDRCRKRCHKRGSDNSGPCSASHAASGPGVPFVGHHGFGRSDSARPEDIAENILNPLFSAIGAALGVSVAPESSGNKDAASSSSGTSKSPASASAASSSKGKSKSKPEPQEPEIDFEFDSESDFEMTGTDQKSAPKPNSEELVTSDFSAEELAEPTSDKPTSPVVVVSLDDDDDITREPTPDVFVEKIQEEVSQAEASSISEKEDENPVTSRLQQIKAKIDRYVSTYNRINKLNREGYTPASSEDEADLSDEGNEYKLSLSSRILVLEKIQQQLENLYSELDEMTSPTVTALRRLKHGLTGLSVTYADKVEKLLVTLKKQASSQTLESSTSSPTKSKGRKINIEGTGDNN